jgi:hypothetical protein
MESGVLFTESTIELKRISKTVFQNQKLSIQNGSRSFHLYIVEGSTPTDWRLLGPTERLRLFDPGRERQTI